MLNPSYLIKSRHDIYYFRYPLPLSVCSQNNRVSISLQTRCPREALRLAKVLEYHSLNLIESMDFNHMQYKDVVAVFKDHFAKLLYLRKLNMDEFGPLPRSEVKQLEDAIKTLDHSIEHDKDISDTDKLKSDMHKSIMNMSELYDLNIEPHSDNYKLMQSQYKHVVKNLSKDILAYNSKLINYSLEPDISHKASADAQDQRSIYLKDAIESYLRELKGTISDRSYNEQRDCLNYIIDALEPDYLISQLTAKEVQIVKQQLQDTPTGRNKAKLTRGLNLKEQIYVGKENQLNTLSTTSVNKYLAYFSSLFDWAKDNNFIEKNMFKGIRVKLSKKKDRRRDHFTKLEVKTIIDNLGNGEGNKLVKNSSLYWGGLLAVYTGARRNEIASLLPQDIKKDQETDIWYLDITDEEEGKRLKTNAAKRIVPIHSKLIDLGFIEFVDQARKFIKEMPQTGEHNTRLLYQLTYTDHDGWGRKLGRWFNESYLTSLELKTAKKTLHSLRHSFITNLSAKGVEYPHIRAIVGHEAGTVTETHYAHFGIEHLKVFKQAIEKLSY